MAFIFKKYTPISSHIQSFRKMYLLKIYFELQCVCVCVCGNTSLSVSSRDVVLAHWYWEDGPDYSRRGSFTLARKDGWRHGPGKREKENGRPHPGSLLARAWVPRRRRGQASGSEQQMERAVVGHYPHFGKWLYEAKWPVATHSSVLAWRVPGTVGPGGLPSMGSHRIRHDWIDLAAAAAAAGCLPKWVVLIICSTDGPMV